jgi:hypothetical protein
MNDTTRKLHWAAQAAAGVGRALVPKEPDFSHESFTWSDPLGALLQAPVNGRRAGIRFRDLTLIVVEENEVRESFAMRGRTLDEGFAFFERLFGATIERPPDGMPPLPDDYLAGDDELAAHERLYSTANAILGRIRAGDARWSPVRCWPHHFDIATLLTLSGSGEEAHTIGAGLAPGDAASPEPYYYVTPWPYPAAGTLPPLRHGRWNTQGWTGAILPAANDAATIEYFVLEAVKALLGGSAR